MLEYNVYYIVDKRCCDATALICMVKNSGETLIMREFFYPTRRFYPCLGDFSPIETGYLEQKINIMSGSAGLTAPDMEIYLRLLSCPTYRQNLDSVIVNEANQVVSFANIWLDTADFDFPSNILP